MTTMAQEKQAALDWIEAHRQRFSDFHLEIWHYAETAFREYRSARAYVELLRQEGFSVEEGSGQMPTAFMATWGTGARGWQPTRSMMRCRKTPNSPCRIVRRAKGSTPGRRDIPTRTRP